MRLATMAGRRLFLAAALAVPAWLGCGSSADRAAGGKADDLDGIETPARTPSRIIWLIGDGMGVGQITAAAYDRGEPLAMLSMPEVGVVSTHEHEFVTTDSAASATAMASGHKTHYEGVGVVPGTTAEDQELEELHQTTVIDEAQRVGWRTGLVATTAVVDATPAAFAAHRANRRDKDGIALDIFEAGVDVLIGGGRDFFDDRTDGKNLLSRMRRDGYSVASTPTGLKRVAGKNARVVGLLAERDLPERAGRELSLAAMTEMAIASLDLDNDRGFFLMVEGSWIDRESHELDAAGTIAEMHDFDEAVAAALAYARGRDDTLVVVNADHETGGLSVLDGDDAADLLDAVGGADAANRDTAFRSGDTPPAIDVRGLGSGALAPKTGRLLPAYGFMSTASRPSFSGPGFVFKSAHSPTLVPVFAEGTAARFVAGARDNAELGLKIRALIAEGGKDGDEPDPESAEAPKNLVVVVTDGLGLSALAALQYAAGAPVSTRLPVAGLAATHGDALVATAPEAATSLWSAPEPLLAIADGAGKRTGLVTSAAIDEPALAPMWGGGSIAAASPSTDGVDLVFAGGGDAVDSALEAAWSDRGAAVERGWSRAPGDPSRPLVRLIAAGRLDAAGARLDPGTAQPSLEEMTEVALERLDAAGEPFVLVVYAAGLDERLAGLDRGGAVVDEIADWDGAVRAAAAFAAADERTAVVALGLRDSTLTVLDNHYAFHKRHCGVAVRCGGPELFTDLPIAADGVSGTGGFSDVALQGDFADISLLLQYSWLVQESGGARASANFVPLFAAGPGARALSGFAHLGAVGAILGGWAGRP